MAPAAPATSRLIDRGELLAVLDRAVTRKVTVISAPAGSGKTSLLRSWMHRSGQQHRFAVLQVRRGQQDAQQFWLGLLRAVRQACATTASQPDPPAPTPAFDGPAMVDRVLSELAASNSPVVLIIDGLHELAAPDALAQLTGLLTDLPEGVHAVLATRRDLPMRLHGIRLAGELAEIRAADLRFTESETQELLHSAGITLPVAGAALLRERTEGWAAGLRLAAIALAGHPDPERFVAEFSGSSRTVAEYLIAEVLERQPADVQRLLLRTSILDRVNGELADLLTGRAGSERILLNLEDANAFVLSLDPDRTWFRYHHLFADLLRLELRRTQPEDVPGLHRTAARWLAGHGEAAGAICHTQAAGDWADAARMLADAAFSLTNDGQAQTIEALLQAFPPGHNNPELFLVRAGIALLHGRLDEAAAYLGVATVYAGMAPPGRQGRLRMAIAALKLSLGRRRGDLADVTEQARFLTGPLTGGSSDDIAMDGDLRAVALMNLGIVEAWSLGSPDAERHLAEGAALARLLGRHYLEVACLAQVAFASKIHPFDVTRQRCQEAIALADRHGWRAEPIVAPALITLAGCLAWTGDLGESERWLQRAAAALRTDSGPGITLLLHHARATMAAGLGRHREVIEELTAAEALRSQLTGSHALASQVTGWRLATLARAGLLGEARAGLAALDSQQASTGEVANARAALCLVEGDPAAALRAVRDVVEGTAPVIGYVTVVESHLLAGLAHSRLDEQRAANQAAEQALGLAEPDRLVLPFLMTGSADLLEALPAHQTAHAALIASILDIMHGTAVSPGERPAPQAEALSPSELRVLRYLPTQLSRPEIARELSVSVNTVNTHIRNIYAKLQARDRSAAVRRARELRLLAANRNP